jgi:hypothetical protein
MDDIDDRISEQECLINYKYTTDQERERKHKHDQE